MNPDIKMAQDQKKHQIGIKSQGKYQDQTR